MILSFHPCFEGEKNITCAGRMPGPEDLSAIQAADAVILHQGCIRDLYAMSRENCKNIFPNYDARFKYPDKIGQIELFREKRINHPKTDIYLSVASFSERHKDRAGGVSFVYPFVFKFNWGGEGETVRFINSTSALERILQIAARFEESGQKGFLLQAFVPAGNRSLRVVVIGQTLVSYWRVQKNPESFYTSLAKGAVIDRDSDPKLQETAREAVRHFCCATGINLAGIDILFSLSEGPGFDQTEPIFLEINYFFGRQGLGGSDPYYALLEKEIRKWIDGLGLAV